MSKFNIGDLIVNPVADSVFYVVTANNECVGLHVIIHALQKKLSTWAICSDDILVIARFDLILNEISNEYDKQGRLSLNYKVHK